MMNYGEALVEASSDLDWGKVSFSLKSFLLPERVIFISDGGKGFDYFLNP